LALLASELLVYLLQAGRSSAEEGGALAMKETKMHNTMNPYADQGMHHDTAVDKIRDAACHAGHALSRAASAVSQTADNAACAVGSRMESLSEKVRQRGPHEGMLGRATEGVADTLERSGRYIEGGFGQMCEDTTNLIRQHPWPALMFGLGVGFLLASVTRR